MLLIPQLSVRNTKHKGRGVFATKDIPAGTVIADYLGIVIRSSKKPKEVEHDEVYDMWYSDKADISPLPKSKGAHLINTSCEPNCAMTTKERHTLIFTLRKIHKGEELSYDYFLGPQDDEESAENCECGSDICRGTMFSNPKQYDAWDTQVEKEIGDADEKPPVRYGEMLPALESYPQNVPDNVIFPLFGSRSSRPTLCKDVTVLKNTKALRKIIRETGKQIRFPELGITVAGVLFGGQVLIASKK